MKISELAGKRILLLGYGREGRATHAFLSRFVPDAQVSFADKAIDPAYLEKQKDYDLVIRSAGVPKRLVRITYTTATNIFFANVKGKTIGVTGSKGKSTTASLIAAILKETGAKVRLAGNIGYPLLEALMDGNTSEDIFVCELSSYQLDDITHSPYISVITNLFPEHMDYHNGFEAYAAAKANIIARAGNDDVFVFNDEVPELVALSKRTKAQAVPFLKRLPFPETGIRLLGKHNVANVRAAVSVARILRIPDPVSEKAVRSFHGLPHRLEHVGTFSGISFYDDAISTTPESTIAALDALPKTSAILLGGLDRGYNFTALAKVIAKSKISCMVLFPDSGEAVSEALGEEGVNIAHVLRTRDMKEAVSFCYGHTPKGTVCLLSTASPSYSVWKNFEEKGDLFQKYVKAHGEGKE
jgi:UDP-N-acetylmuramoylalanine--D-glutamate ligase